ncbi:unnamed protein product [Porites evermanni]|uniref:Uncharacterized protein n=1 Tax=Porites evermanni TaxID=104178 RepID=A0ABN8M2Q0_9CNID|nr:unnamed protein product [Porites evermanni]
MTLLLGSILISLVFFGLVRGNYVSVKVNMSCENGVCSRKGDQGPCIVKDDQQRLFIIKWVMIKGHVRQLELEPGEKFKMITLASKPAIFELPDFLSDEECDHIIELAEMFGLEGSIMHTDEYQEKHRKEVKGHAIGAAGIFASWDKNKDKEITKEEVIHFSQKYKFLYMKPNEVDKMIERLKIKAFDDGKVTIQEFRKLPTAAMDAYMNRLKETSPVHRDRNSNQAWIHQGSLAGDVMKRLRKRIQKLTKLPDGIIRGSEPLQVVKYDEYGHYNVHHDGQPIASHSHLNCCHLNVTKVPSCRLCSKYNIQKFIMLFLQQGKLHKRESQQYLYPFSFELYIKSMDNDKFNLMEFCYDGNLVVKPKRGKAIMWYNHFIDEETGWLGERDDYTLHGGCGVRSGVKWIANNWITAPDASLAHIKSNFEVADDELIEQHKQFNPVVRCVLQKRLDKSCENGVCYREQDQGPCKPNNDEPRLFRWDPVRKGHVRELELEPGKKFKMITLASKPPLFEIPDFLSENECNHIISLAERVGLRGSDVHLDEELNQRKEFLQGQASGKAGSFHYWDKNGDGVITRDEVIEFAEGFKFLYLDPTEVDDMISKLNIEEFDDDQVTHEEFKTLPTAAMDQYMNNIKETHPAHRERFSNQAWLLQGKFADDVLRRLRKRITKLTRLSDRTIRGGEPLQVVKYDRNGHYNAHYDSQQVGNISHIKCCHLDLSLLPNCRVCRYATILYYLNDIEDGGETAFPVVDNATFDKQRAINLFINRLEIRLFVLLYSCQTPVCTCPHKLSRILLAFCQNSSFSNDYVIRLACAQRQKVTSKLVSPSCSPTMSKVLQYSDLFYVFSFRRKVT